MDTNFQFHLEMFFSCHPSTQCDYMKVQPKMYSKLSPAKMSPLTEGENRHDEFFILLAPHLQAFKLRPYGF